MRHHQEAMMTQRIIDLRSDTVTQPTAAMRQAMAEAVVGDDVFGDDPTVQALERRTAELLGKEAALFVPSGTMANQLAVRCHTQPGDEILLDAGAHIYWYEAGAAAALAGVTCRLLPGVRGLFTADDVRAALRPPDVHAAPARLVALENTHNRGGGAVWPLAQVAEVCATAHDAGLAVHLDGARLWNAAVATGTAEADYARHCDSVSVCFSKGLGAPIGSALAGSADFIARARRFRKQFGGGMRQVGIIAAGALHALEHHRARLADDHAHARLLAAGLREIDGLHVADPVETNMVYIETPDAAGLSARLRDAGILINPTAPHTLRAVTSLAVDAADIHQTVTTLRAVMG
jgi:threonine aldolase